MIVCDHPGIADPPTFADVKARLAALHDLRAARGQEGAAGATTAQPGPLEAATPGQLDAMRESMEILSDPQMMRRVRDGRHAVAAGDLIELEEPAGSSSAPAGSRSVQAQWRVMLTGPVARELAEMDEPAATAVRERLAALATRPAEQGRALGMGLVGVLCVRGASHRILYALHQEQRLATVLSIDDR